MVLLLLIITFMLVIVNWIMIGRRNYTTVTGRSYSARPMRLGPMRWLAFAFVGGYLTLSFILPALVIIQTSYINIIGFDVLNPDSYSFRNWETILSLQIPRQSFINSLIVSLVATTIGVCLYSLVSYVIVKTDFKGRRALDLAAWVPWAVPALVLGLGLSWTVLLSPLGFLYGSLALFDRRFYHRRLPDRHSCDDGFDDPNRQGARGVCARARRFLARYVLANRHPAGSGWGNHSLGTRLQLRL